MDLINKCKNAYIEARPFDKQQARRISGVAASVHETSANVTRRLFDLWLKKGVPPDVQVLFSLAPPMTVKCPVPTSAGFYWAKHLNPESDRLDSNRDWETVEVFEDDTREPVLGVYVLSHAEPCELDEFFWGPPIQAPR